MPNFTVSNDIDTFMQSANKAEMLENTGAAAELATKVDQIALGVADPTTGGGVVADLHTEGYSNETPPRYFKKVGVADTDWEQVQIGDIEITSLNFPNITTSELDAVGDAEAGNTYINTNTKQFVRFTGPSSYEVLTVNGAVNLDITAQEPAMTLAASRLYESGVVSGSADVFNPTSTLVIYPSKDITSIPTGYYIYHTGEQGPAGWYDFNNVGGGVVTSAVVTPNTVLAVNENSGARYPFMFHSKISSVTPVTLVSVPLNANVTYSLKSVLPFLDLKTANLRVELEYSGLFEYGSINSRTVDTKLKELVSDFTLTDPSESTIYQMESGAYDGASSPNFGVFSMDGFIRTSSAGNLSLSIRQIITDVDFIFCGKANIVITALSN